ncbi:MAG: threonylcarbamoyl-AMP synthase [Nitrospirae bacterium]|nr:MAG: threonylcarbamoyl-AMP synthase [Nitrospirota bacterium]
MTTHRDCSTPSLREAADIVRGGGIIAFPTETFYGLGARPFDARAVQRLVDLKGRSLRAAPILVLIRSRADLAALVSEVPPAAERLMEACWPGPLTIVFRAAAAVPPVLTAGTGTIGVRLSAHPDVQRLLEAVGGPLTGTSANRSGQPPATTAEEVERALGDGVDAILNGGATPGGLPSTVVDTTVTPPRVLREGRVPTASLQSILNVRAA